MNFPLSWSDISVWLAVAAIILLVTSELISLSPEFSQRILIDKKRLRLAAVGCGFGFVAALTIRIIQLF